MVHWNFWCKEKRKWNRWVVRAGRCDPMFCGNKERDSKKCKLECEIITWRRDQSVVETQGKLVSSARLSM